MGPRASNKKHDKFVIGFVGQIHKGKGWHLLFDAFEEIQKINANVKLIYAGDGMDKNSLTNRISKCNADVEYLGLVENAGKNLIPDLDVLVLASWSEGMPMSVIEAFSFGVPVVATKVGGLPDMILHKKNGFLIDRDAGSIEAAINTLIADPHLYGSMSRQARLTYENHFEIQRVVDEYHGIL